MCHKALNLKFLTSPFSMGLNPQCIGLRMLHILCIYGVLCFLILCEFDFWPLKDCSITKCCLQFTSIFSSILAISPADPFLKGFSRIDSSKGSRGSLYSPTNKHHCDHSLIVRFWKFYHFCCWLFPISFCDFMTNLCQTEVGQIK